MATDWAGALPGPAAGPSELSTQELDDLLSRMAYGDEAAFAEVYDQFAGLIYGLAQAITGDAARSEEVTADVMTELWRAAPRYSAAEGSVQAWVMTMTQQRAKRYARPARSPGRHRRVRAAGSLSG